MIQVVTEAHIDYLLFANGTPFSSKYGSIKRVACYNKNGAPQHSKNPKCRSTYEFTNMLGKITATLDAILKKNIKR